MAVSVEQLFGPFGPLEEEFFPEAGDVDSGEEALSDELADRIQSYLTRSQQKVASYTGAVIDTDAAVKAWALHLAFHALWLQSINRPAAASLEGLGSAGYGKDQRDAFKEQADYWSETYLTFAPEVPVTEEGEARRSYPVRNRFTY